MKNSRIENIARNSITGVINKFAMMFFPFVIRTLMIKYLGAEYLGLNSLFISILQVFSLAELGMSNAIVFSMYKPIACGDDTTVNALYNLYRKIYRIIGTVIFLIGILILPFLDSFITGEIPATISIKILYLVYLFNSVISYYLFAYKECLLISNQRNDVINNISTFIHIILYIVQSIFIIIFKNYYVYIIFLPISTIAINILQSYQVKKLFPQYRCDGSIDKETLKDLMKKVSGLMLYKISGVCRNSFDSIILSSFLGLVILAKYQNYYYIINAVGGIIAIITTSATATIGNSIATESVEINFQKFKIFSFFYNWISAWATVCLLCLYQPFMILWLGEEYLFTFDIVILLCIYFYTCKISDVIYMYRQAVGLWWEDKWRPIIEAITNLVLNFLAVKYFGVAGVIISTIITIVFINIPWGGYVLYKNYFNEKILDYLKRIVWDGVILVGTCFLTYSICGIVKQAGVMELLIKLSICLIVPNIIFYIAYVRTTEFSKIVNIMKHVLSR